MPNNNKAKQNGERTPAVDLLQKFLKENKIALIVDEVQQVNNDSDGVLYSVRKVPRLRAYYKDQLEEKKVDTIKKGKVEIPTN